MHFYEKTENGVEPRHFVANASRPGQTRPSRVTDAKKAAKEGKIWYPSVTSILNILDKPALKNWHIEQHLKTVWDLGEDLADVTDYDEFLKLVKIETERRLDEAPKAGSDIHKVIEQYLFTGSYPLLPIERSIVEGVEKAIKENCGDFEKIEKEKYFINSGDGYAGQIDLVVYTPTEFWVIDFKSKQFANKFKPGKMAYPDHIRQLAAYARPLLQDSKQRDVQTANIFICLETGEINFHPHSDLDLINGWPDFKDCLSIYHRNIYSPFKEE